MAKKRKKSSTQQLLSPKKYILTRARSLPVYKCLINKDWKSGGLATITVTRKHTNGNITAGFFLVDLLAHGVKDTHFQFNEPERFFFESVYEQIPEDYLEEVPYALVHNIIYGASAFAGDYNIAQHHDFSVTQYLLEEDTEDIEWIDIDFGIGGKPFFEITSDTDMEDMEDDQDDDDYESWTDDDWRHFFREKESSFEEMTDAVNALFDKWIAEGQEFARNRTDSTRQANVLITYDALELAYHKDESEREEMQDILERINMAATEKEINELEARINRMIAANPGNPIYYNYLAICAQLNGDDARYKNIVESTVKKFPGYLFGKIAYANLLLDDEKTEAVEELFDHTYFLPGLYPDREVFHFTELIGFNSTMIRLFLRTKNVVQAKINSDILYELDYGHLEKSNLFVKAEQEFFLQKMEIVQRYIREKNYAE